MIRRTLTDEQWREMRNEESQAETRQNGPERQQHDPWRDRECHHAETGDSHADKRCEAGKAERAELRDRYRDEDRTPCLAADEQTGDVDGEAGLPGE
nr:hypothetical protein [Prauserella halophila]